MTTHHMGLQPRFFDYMQSGTKRIELRLFDDKRQKIQLGDHIIFSKDDQNSLEVEVIGLLRYQSFTDLFADFDISLLADQSMTKDELLHILEEFYPKEKQQNLGVIGLRFKLI